MGLPSPVLVAGVRAAVSQASQLGLDVRALLLLVLRPRLLVVHPLPFKNVTPPRRRLPRRKWHHLILL